jgi:hypothetical protein
VSEKCFGISGWQSIASSIEILGARLEEECLKKGRIFFSWSPPYFVKWREVLKTPQKSILWRKLPFLGRVEISQFFTRRSFPKNICRTCANILVQYQRFLWLQPPPSGLHYSNDRRWRACFCSKVHCRLVIWLIYTSIDKLLGRSYICRFRTKDVFHHKGVDVMITTFCDFRQFSAKKLAFF